MAAPMGRALAVVGHRGQASLIFGAAALVLLLSSAVPLAAVALELSTPGAWRELLGTLGRSETWLLFGRSLSLSLVVTLCAVGLGVVMGVLLGRTDVAGRSLVFWLHLLPLALPPFLLALGWFHVFGQRGLLGSAATSTLLFGPVGVVVTLVLALSPLVTVITVLGLQGIDASLEESALVVASPLGVVLRVLLPLAWRSIAFAALVVFALSVSELGVPMFLRVDTYSAAVFTRLGGVDYAPGEAAALALPLLGLGLVLVAADARILGRSGLDALGSRSRGVPALRLGRARGVASGFLWLLVLAALLPVAALATRAGVSGVVEASRWLGRSLVTSLAAAISAASIIVLVGVVVGHALARSQPGASILSAVPLLAFMAPAAVLGVGLIGAWNHRATQIVYSSLAVLVLGLAARYMVVGVRLLQAAVQRSSPHYEDTAAAFGSGFARRLFRIVLPMQRRAIFGTWIVALLFCLRDLDTIVVYYPPGLETLLVRIFTFEANGPEPTVAGLCMFQIALTALLLLALGVLARRLR